MQWRFLAYGELLWLLTLISLSNLLAHENFTQNREGFRELLGTYFQEYEQNECHIEYIAKEYTHEKCDLHTIVFI